MPGGRGQGNEDGEGKLFIPTLEQKPVPFKVSGRVTTPSWGYF